MSAGWRIVPILCLGGSLCGGACAASHPADLAQDGRLAQRANCLVQDGPLSALLEDFQGKTGVSLRLSASYEDRPITLRLADLRLRDAMRAIVDLYGDRWETSTIRNERPYTLSGSPARKQRQRRLLEALGRSLRAELRLAIQQQSAQGWPDEMIPDDFTASERAQFKEETRQRARILGQLSPDALERLLGGDH